VLEDRDASLDAFAGVDERVLEGRKVVVALVDDATIAELHERYLDVAEPTDVLSFPHGEIVASGDTARRDFRITSIGFVFQDFELLDYLSVFDNIVHPYRITGALKLDRKVRERARELAGKMGIGGYLERHPDDLSQGERQRAAICRALLPHPKLILADEATGNLDPENKERILDLLFAAVEEHGASLLAVTHDHELLPRFDRVVDFHDFRGTGGE